MKDRKVTVTPSKYSPSPKVTLTMDVGVWEETLWSIEFPDDLETLQQIIDALEVYKAKYGHEQ